MRTYYLILLKKLNLMWSCLRLFPLVEHCFIQDMFGFLGDNSIYKICIDHVCNCDAYRADSIILWSTPLRTLYFYHFLVLSLYCFILWYFSLNTEQVDLSGLMYGIGIFANIFTTHYAFITFYLIYISNFLFMILFKDFDLVNFDRSNRVDLIDGYILLT